MAYLNPFKLFDLIFPPCLATSLAKFFKKQLEMVEFTFRRFVNTGSITSIGSTRTRTQTINANYFRMLRNYLDLTNIRYYLFTLISAR